MHDNEVVKELRNLQLPEKNRDQLVDPPQHASQLTLDERARPLRQPRRQCYIFRDDLIRNEATKRNDGECFKGRLI